jgi:hypothetical protein
MHTCMHTYMHTYTYEVLTNMCDATEQESERGMDKGRGGGGGDRQAILIRPQRHFSV